MSRPASIKAKFVDSLQNLLTGMGVSGLDKSFATQFIETRLTSIELENAYTSDWLSGKVCDVPPFDMTREWRSYSGSIEADKKIQLIEFEKKIGLPEKIKDALVWSRIYGGAGIIINVDDGTDPHEPLVIENLKQNSLRWLVVSDSVFLKGQQFEHDPFSGNYGFPVFYRMAPSSTLIHHSRVIRFDGVPLPLQARRRNQYWGKSIIERLYGALQNAAGVQDNINNLVHEATVDVIKIPDLQDTVSNKEAKEALQNRFGIAKMQKSVNRMLLLDKEEDYETHKQTFAGLPDLMQKFLNVVAGAADIPITRLLGQSPGGLSSTGKSDLANYYDFIAAQQKVVLSNKLKKLDEIMYQSLFGTSPEVGELDFKFNPLWQLTDVDKATTQVNRATRDSTYLTNGVIDEVIVAKQLLAEDTYVGIDADYIKMLEAETKEDNNPLPDNDGNLPFPGPAPFNDGGKVPI